MLRQPDNVPSSRENTNNGRSGSTKKRDDPRINHLQQQWAHNKKWSKIGNMEGRHDKIQIIYKATVTYPETKRVARSQHTPNQHTKKKTRNRNPLCNTTTRETMMPPAPPSHPLHQTAPCAINNQALNTAVVPGHAGLSPEKTKRPTARVCTTTTTATPGTTYFENKIGRKQDSNHGTHAHAHAHTADIKNQEKTQAGRETNNRYIDKSIVLEKHRTRTKADIFCSTADM